MRGSLTLRGSEPLRSFGNFFYLTGYANPDKDVKMARYSNPLAALKPIGMMGSFFCCVTACVVMIAY